MKLLILTLVIITLGLTGCTVETHPSEIDGQSVIDVPKSWHYADWNHHRFIVTRNAYGSGGIHDPDCPYCIPRR